MPVRQFSCPECQKALRVSDQVQPGMTVRCPSCSARVVVPDEGSANVPEEGVTPRAAPARRPREQFTDEPPESRSRRDDWDEEDQLDRSHGGMGLDGLSSDYSINIGEWFRYGSAHWSSYVGPWIGYFFLVLLITFGLAITCIGILAVPFLTPVLFAGFTIVALAQLKGKPWTFSDFFGGFRRYGSVLGATWLIALLTGFWTIPGQIVQGVGQARYAPTFPSSVQTGPQANPEDPLAEFRRLQEAQQGQMTDPIILFGAFLRLVGLVVNIYFSVRCFFALPLLFDRECGAVECIQGSFRLSRGHFWGLLGVVLLMGLINVGGALLCGIGALFTFPLTMLVQVAGYLLIAGTRPPVPSPAPAYGD